MSRPIVGRGTSEGSWSAWIRALPLLELRRCHALVVAPHPDDETLGLGGTLALLEQAGAEIEVIAVTDGERGTARGVEDAALARRRPAEVVEALELMLGRCPPVHRLGLPDGAVGDDVAGLAAAIRARLREDSCCFVTHRDDGHPDHEAAYAAAAAACTTAGRPLLEYPIWLWHWALPDDLDTERLRLRRIDLPPALRRRKERAVAAFVTQTVGDGSPVLPPHVVERFVRPYEVLAL